MGAQYQMFNKLEREISKIKASEIPNHILIMEDVSTGVLTAVATTHQGKSWKLSAEELARLMPAVRDGEIKYVHIIDDLGQEEGMDTR